MAGLTSVAVLVPVLARPERVPELLRTVEASSALPGGGYVDVVFVASPGDTAELAALLEAAAAHLVVPWAPGKGDYARKLNHAVAALEEYDWYFLAADDLRFHVGWLAAALACHEQTNACVVGTNDLGNASVVHGEHSTHTLVSRRYLECGTIDDPAKLLHDGYDHNFVDNEFVETAIHRETYAQAKASHVEHLHPHWRKADIDDTYRKGQARFADDRRLFQARRRLWA